MMAHRRRGQRPWSGGGWVFSPPAEDRKPVDSLEGKKDATKSYEALTKLLVTLATGTLILSPTVVGLAKAPTSISPALLIAAAVLLLLSVALGILVLSALTGTQVQGKYDIRSGWVLWLSLAQWFFFFLGITVFAAFGLKVMIAGLGESSSSPGIVIYLPPESSAVSNSWTATEPSPAFAIGAARFDEDVRGCPLSRDISLKADVWVGKVVEKWKQRSHPSNKDSIIVVGTTDRLPLSHALRYRYDSNVGLARARAETVKSMLIARTTSEPAEHRITPDRVMVQVVGPAYTAARVQQEVAPERLCENRDLREDRRVVVWLPAR